MPKIVIKKQKEDSSAKVIMIISGLLIVASIASFLLMYSEYSDKKVKLAADRQDITPKKIRDLNAATEKALDLANIVGWLAHHEIKASESDAWNNYDTLKGFLNKMADFLSANYQINTFKSWDNKEEIEGKKYLNLQELVEVMESKRQENTQKGTDSISDRNVSRKEVTKIIGNENEKGELYVNIGEKTAEIESMRIDIASLESQVNEIIEQGDRDVLSLQESIKDINIKIINETKKGEVEILKITGEKKEFDDRLVKLRHRLEQTGGEIEIDGEIILADMTNGYVCIDLGQKDAVIKGMSFDIFTILKGGIKKEKGKAKITKIFDDYSQAAIIQGTVKADDPINVKDLVNSDIYNRQKVKTFIFAGTPVGKYELSDLQRKITEFGGRILSEVTPDITYIVVGKDFENNENYKKAVHLGAVVLREKELYDLLRLNWID